MELFEAIGLDAGYVIIGLTAFFILQFVLILVLFSKNKGMQKKYDLFMKGAKGENLESAFARKFGQVDGLIEKARDLDEHMADIDDMLLGVYQKIGIVKYDAFEMGGKLSFVLAMLNDQNDGFILNSMHSTREGCYTYIKEIIKGESFVILAAEEKEALEMAINSNVK